MDPRRGDKPSDHTVLMAKLREKTKDCDGFEIKISTDTGDVSGTLLSEKVFITSSDTGKIKVPKNRKKWLTKKLK